MTKFSATRLVVYITGLILGSLATWAASQGWGTYDPATGVFDLHPFDLNLVVAGGVSVFGNALAAVSLLRGWKKS